MACADKWIDGGEKSISAISHQALGRRLLKIRVRNPRITWYMAHIAAFLVADASCIFSSSLRRGHLEGITAYKLRFAITESLLVAVLQFARLIIFLG